MSNLVACRLAFSGTHLPAITAPPAGTSRGILPGAGGYMRSASFKHASMYVRFLTDLVLEFVETFWVLAQKERYAT